MTFLPSFWPAFGTGYLPHLLIFCLCLTAVYVQLLPPHKKGLWYGKQYVLPPGPRGQPVVGSLLQWLQVRKRGTMVPWPSDQISKVQLVNQAQYGEMTTLCMGSKTWVLLNTDRVVNEIIAKRASITNERPDFPIAGELVSRNNRFVLQKINRWKEPRYLMHQHIMGAGAKEHQKIIETESVGLLKLYLGDPSAWYAHHYRYTVNIMSRIVVNETLPKSQAELDDLQNVTSTFLSSINSTFAEFFPQLNWLPESLRPWCRHWRKIGESHHHTFRTWWADLKPLAERGAKPSFVRDTVLGKYSGKEDEAMYLTMSVMAAGSDNPRMAMNAWVMACVAAPSAMQRARRELDAACGTDDELRLPGLDDLPALPYVCAVVKEVLRWRPVVPLMPQRALVEDLDFEGYRFPAGTEFLVNSVPVCSHGYDRPGEFLPERWLVGEGGGEAEAGGVRQDLWQFAFNGGRRSCVGYKLAQKVLFVTFARLLYCFDFSRVGDLDDATLNPFKLGEPFPVKIAVRSEAHAQLIIQESATGTDEKTQRE